VNKVIHEINLGPRTRCGGGGLVMMMMVDCATLTTHTERERERERKKVRGCVRGGCPGETDSTREREEERLTWTARQASMRVKGSLHTHTHTHSMYLCTLC